MSSLPIKDDIESYYNQNERIVIFKEDSTTASGQISMIKDTYCVLDEPNISNPKRMHVMAYQKIQCIMPVEEYLKAGGDLDKEKES
jgi:hypothetical protein|tara:strand:+ start:136 stop:393 length:258 start_codon:yes stop_codon:yes gene_type:complete